MKENSLTYYNPVKVIYGRGNRKILLEEKFGDLLLVVTTERGKAQFINDSILKSILNKTKIVWLTEVESNPSITSIQKMICNTNRLSVTSIIGFGGGSALDVAKSIFWGLQYGNDSNSFGIMVNKSFHERCNTSIKFYAIPTTAGTGSEVTPFATVWDNESKKKYSLNGSALWPDIALVDPDLHDTLPVDQTIYTGLDAINQAAESLWNKNANSITLGYSIESLRLGLTTLPRIINDNFSPTERDRMALCSLLAGMAISQTRTALCHSISYPLTAHFGVPHGLACAFTMTEVLKYNISSDDGRFNSLKKVLLIDLLEAFQNLSSSLQIKERIKFYIPSLTLLSNIYDGMNNISRSNNNLKDVDIEVIKSIVINSWNTETVI